MGNPAKFLTCLSITTALSLFVVLGLPEDTHKIVPWLAGLFQGAIPACYLAVLLVDEWAKAIIYSDYYFLVE